MTMGEAQEYAKYGKTCEGRPIRLWLTPSGDHPGCYLVRYSIADGETEDMGRVEETFAVTHDMAGGGYDTEFDDFFESNSEFNGTAYSDDALELCRRYAECGVSSNGIADDGSVFRFYRYITVLTDDFTETEFRSLDEAADFCLGFAKNYDA